MLIPTHWASYPGGPADLPRGFRVEITASDRFLVPLDGSLLKACHESCLTAFSRSDLLVWVSLRFRSHLGGVSKLVTYPDQLLFSILLCLSPSLCLS